MKKFLKIAITIIVPVLGLFSCSNDLETATVTKPNDGDFKLMSSANNITLEKENAESQTAVTFSWDKSWYGVDTHTNFTVQIDSIGGDFSEPVISELIDNEKSYTNAELNYIALKFKLDPDVEGQLKVRLKANLKYDVMPVYSDTKVISVTPFSTLNLKYAMPSALYIQGDAVASNWGYPIPDEQKMVQIDDHRFGLILNLIGGKNFAFITSSTAWSDPAYVAPTASAPAEGGDFIPSGSQTTPAWGGSPMSSPADSGTYKIIIDFVEGTYSVEPEPSIMAVPNELYITGDATPLGWSTGPSQKFTKVDDYTFAITVPLTEGKYDFISALTWSDPAYKAKTGSEPLMGGNFIESGSATVPAWGGSDITAPAPGTYTITVNFKSGTYVLSL